MKKALVSITFLPILYLAACSASNHMWTQTANSVGVLAEILNDANPFLEESNEWEAYGIKMAQQDLSYVPANSAEQAFVSKKMDQEYPAAINRLAAAFTRTDKAREELARENQGYRFKYNHVITVKDKKTQQTIGYCANYDGDRYREGKILPETDKTRIRKDFVFMTQDKPLSLTTSNKTFIKRVCGEDFYRKYKDPRE
ncbi:hypothetical protein [Acinetobacter larvae]|uniref:Uncharacterized protein n=1 Tax=Acinetobacter larvae TaxID=1789224 RepID=A0A1B2LZZ5_9GAMM|nr:hypothetical protein [Acinetobacter larvae]AOA58514.1 hypothetical protein BFG52_09235 [Acinetobacter larvae]